MLTIFDIKRFALHDGPGIRTTVFLKGCPLKCKWCHNPESFSSEPESHAVQRIVDGKEISMARIYGKRVKEEYVLREVLKDEVFYKESGGGVTFSGGEPLMQARDLMVLLKLCGEHGLHRALDTSGHAKGSILAELASETELFLYDLKVMDSLLHKEYTGVDNSLIHRNADMLLKMGKEVIFRVPFIPGVNDGKKEIDAFLDFFSKRKGAYKAVHILPYHKIGSEKYRRLKKDYTFSEVKEVNEIQLNSLKNKITALGVEVSIGG